LPTYRQAGTSRFTARNKKLRAEKKKEYWKIGIEGERKLQVPSEKVKDR